MLIVMAVAHGRYANEPGIPSRAFRCSPSTHAASSRTAAGQRACSHATPLAEQQERATPPSSRASVLPTTRRGRGGVVYWIGGAAGSMQVRWRRGNAGAGKSWYWLWERWWWWWATTHVAPSSSCALRSSSAPGFCSCLCVSPLLSAHAHAHALTLC